jgi:hypothetical protein
MTTADALNKVERLDNGCWVWTGAKQSSGYGHLVFAGSPMLAHRLFFTHFRGPIPAGLTLDHLCRNRLCVNPDHLDPVTQRENNLRSNSPSAINSRATHCPNGHALSGENVRIVVRRDGVHRKCLPCNRIYKQRARARARAALAKYAEASR